MGNPIGEIMKKSQKSQENECVSSYKKVSFVGYISNPKADPTIAKTVLESLIQ